MVLPRQKEITCFQCKFYRPDETRQYQGNCCKPSPQAESGVGAVEPGMEWCFVQVPSETWCGDFEKWMGPAREVGVCPYVPPAQAVVLSKTLKSKVDATAAAVKKTAAPASAPAVVAKKSTKTATKKKAAPKKAASKKK